MEKKEEEEQEEGASVKQAVDPKWQISSKVKSKIQSGYGSLFYLESQSDVYWFGKSHSLKVAMWPERSTQPMKAESSKRPNLWTRTQPHSI